jgi:hypothetical protein
MGLASCRYGLRRRDKESGGEDGGEDGKEDDEDCSESLEGLPAGGCRQGSW